MHKHEHKLSRININLSLHTSELAWLLGIFATFFVVNFLTAERFPVVWLDEVMFIDPAINLYLGNGFNSTAWPYQDHDRQFAGYPPLYALLLTVWMHITSIQPTGLRSMNYVFAILSTGAIVWAV
ncbi:MAG: hypothetical protein OEW08_14590, partial [Gammaproteobacteria bacterium]|nr:hypothetical protein [Gammaproteobacteria bacterium]